MTDHTDALREAADEYRREIERAKEIRKQADEVQRQASDRLAAVMKTAYAAGTKKADILRATNHVWSRTWLDRAVDPPKEAKTDPTS